MHGSADAGIALVETSRTIVKNNVIADGKWGARLTLGSTDNQACTCISRLLMRTTCVLFSVEYRIKRRRRLRAVHVAHDATGLLSYEIALEFDATTSST